MTLLRELALYLTLLLILLFTGSFVLTVNDARHYLQEQLHSHAQDTATSLGVAIAATGSEASSQVATIDAMIDAVFDRGYYRQIRFVDLSGEVLVNSEHTLSLEGVPDWFVQLVDLQTPLVSSEINRGWSPIGQLQVVSHPGYAYRSLWSKVRTDVVLFSLGLLLAVAGLQLILRVVLQPLRRMEAQADRICDRHFEVQTQLPKTRDLRRVVEAMNRMATKLEKAFSEQVTLTEDLRRRYVQDPLTGLLNDNALQSRMTAVLNNAAGEAGGSLVLIQVRELALLNRQHGQSFVDELLVSISHWLKKTLSPWPGAVSGRRNTSCFAVFVPACGVNENRRITELLYAALGAMAFFSSAPGANSLRIAAVTHSGRCASQLLLEQGDQQLRTLDDRVANCYQVSDITGLASSPFAQWGEARWQDELEQAIEGGKIGLYGQPVMDVDGGVAFVEILARITLDGTEVAADAYLPVVERGNLCARFDRTVFFALTDYMDSQDDYSIYCLNISPYALADDQFYHWLLDALKLRQDLAQRLILETSERSILLMGEKIAERVTQLTATGCQFSIDHFGVSCQALTCLQMINAHYLKVDGSFAQGVEQNHENQLYIRTLSMLAESKDIGILAQGIENQKDWDALKSLGVVGGQGHFLGRPERL